MLRKISGKIKLASTLSLILTHWLIRHHLLQNHLQIIIKKKIEWLGTGGGGKHIGLIWQMVLMKFITSFWNTCLMQQSNCYLYNNNMCQSQDFPDGWKESTVIPFPKPGKDQTYLNKPAAPTSCLRKIMDRMITHRLTWFPKRQEHHGPFGQTGYLYPSRFC